MKYCLAVAFAERTALREEIFRITRMRGAEDLRRRVQSRAQAQFRRFWTDDWAYAPPEAIAEAIGADGVRYVQFSWQALQAAASEKVEVATEAEGAAQAAPVDPVETALDVASDCMALHAALRRPRNARLEPKALWDIAKTARAEMRRRLEAALVRPATEDTAAADDGAADPALDFYMAVVREARGQLQNHEARQIAIGYLQPRTEIDDLLAETGDEATLDLRRADLMVRAGRLAEAYLLLGERTDTAARNRQLLLDHALRASWVDYDETLDAIADPALAPLVERLRASARTLGRPERMEALAVVGDEALMLGLGQVYVDALNQGRVTRRSRPHETLAAWLALKALKAAHIRPGEHTSDRNSTAGRLIIVAEGADTPSPAWLDHAGALATRGMVVHLIAADGATGDLGAAREVLATNGPAPDAGVPALILRGFQFIAPDLAWSWDRLVGAAGRAWVGSALLPPQVASPFAFDLACRSERPRGVLAGSAVAIDAGALSKNPEAALLALAGADAVERLTTTGAFLDEPVATGRPVVIVHEGGDAFAMDHDGPVHTIALNDEAFAEDEATGLKEALSALPADLPDDTPVLFRAQDLTYPAGYARGALTAFSDHGGRIELTFLSLRRSTRGDACQPVVVNGPGLSPLACLATSCLTLGTVRAAAAAAVLPRLSAVIEMPDPGFLMIPLFDLPFLTFESRRVRRFMEAEKDRGIVRIEGRAAFSENALDGVTESSKRILAPVIRQRAFIRRLADTLESSDFSSLSDRTLDDLIGLCREIVEAGYLAAARSLMAHALDAPSADLIASPLYKELLGLVRDLGCQPAFARRHQYMIGALIQERPSEVGATMEVLASALAPAEVEAVVLAAVGALKADNRDRALLRILDATNKYAGPATTSWVLMSILDRVSSAVLQRPAVRGFMRGMLSRSTLEPAQIQGLDLPPAVIETLAVRPPLEAARAAIGTGDAAALADVLGVWMADDLPLSDLAKELRTYSHQLATAEVGKALTAYRMYDTPDARLRFAGIVGDLSYLESHLGDAPQGDADIIGRAQLGHADWLQDRLSGLGAPLGVVTPILQTGSLIQVFQSVLAATGSKMKGGARRKPKVTAVMTVFEPDAEMLALAVDSALNQEGVVVELIVIDDGSSAAGAAAIDAVLADRPGVVFERSPVNQGPYLGRNRALELATGDYIAIQDGDDVSHPARFRKQVEAFETAGPDCMLCTTWHLRIDEGGKPQFEHDFSLLGDGTMTSMFRRQAFDRVGGFARVRSRGDVEIRERIRAALGDRAVVRVDYPMVFCNAAPGTLSNRTARSKPHYLKLFRTNFDRQHRFLRQAVAVGEPVTPPDSAAPVALRP